MLPLTKINIACHVAEKWKIVFVDIPTVKQNKNFILLQLRCLKEKFINRATNKSYVGVVFSEGSETIYTWSCTKL